MDRTKNQNNSMPDCSELTKFLSIQDWSTCRRISSQLIYTIDDFVQANSNLNLVKYQDILQASGIEWDIDSMTNADVDSLDIVTVLALLVAAYGQIIFPTGHSMSLFKMGPSGNGLFGLKSLPMFGSGEKRHIVPGENDQFRPKRNRQQPRLVI